MQSLERRIDYVDVKFVDVKFLRRRFATRGILFRWKTEATYDGKNVLIFICTIVKKLLYFLKLCWYCERVNRLAFHFV